VFDNILPNRFSLLIDLGLAAVLATFVDCVLSARRRFVAISGTALVAAVAVAWWPALVPASHQPIPRYFQGGGDVNRLSVGTAALVFPVPYAGPPETAEPSLWQAAADFRLKLVSVTSISAAPTGAVAFGSTVEPLTCVATSLQLRGTADVCRTTPMAVLSQLRALHVSLVILGPSPHQADIVAYVTALIGSPPQQDQGVLIWSV
jgi:hypothetical protein